jgi:hypothetical protein
MKSSRKQCSVHLKICQPPSDSRYRDFPGESSSSSRSSCSDGLLETIEERNAHSAPNAECDALECIRVPVHGWDGLKASISLPSNLSQYSSVSHSVSIRLAYLEE